MLRTTYCLSVLEGWWFGPCWKTTCPSCTLRSSCCSRSWIVARGSRHRGSARLSSLRDDGSSSRLSSQLFIRNAQNVSNVGPQYKPQNRQEGLELRVVGLRRPMENHQDGSFGKGRPKTFLRDPIWQGIGAIIALVALAVTVLLSFDPFHWLARGPELRVYRDFWFYPVVSFGTGIESRLTVLVLQP